MSLRTWIIGLLSRNQGRQLTEFEVLTAKNNGTTLDAIDRAVATKQLKCNHKKGGRAVVRLGRVEFTNGTGSNYAVRKHQIMNGDFWVDCLRCGKKWRPPIRSEYKNDREFYKAVEEYQTAVDYETNNSTSTSLQFSFALNGSRDAGYEYVRKQLANS